MQMGVGLALTIPRGPEGYTPVNPEAAALFARMAVQPSQDIKVAIDQFYTDAYMFGKFDAFYFEAFPVEGNQLTAGGKLICWPNSAYDGTFSGTKDFVAGSGYNGNGTNFIISTGFLPSATTNFQLFNDCAGGVISNTIGTASQTRQIVGYSGSGSGVLDLEINASTSNGSKGRLNSTSSRVFTHSPMEPGHWMVSTNTTATKYTTYRNGVAVDTAGTEVNQTGWTGGDFKLYGSGNNTGAATSFGKLRCSAHWFGAALTATEASDFYYALNKLLAAVGAEALVTPPSSFATLAMSPNNPVHGSTVTYTIALAGGTNAGNFTIAQSGDLTDGDFSATLANAITAACAGLAGVSYSAGVLTFTNAFVGPLVFSRTITSAPVVGKTHIVQLSNPSSLAIYQPYAALIVGAPAVAAIPYLRGVNVSGAEFGGTAFYPSHADTDYYAAKGFTVIRFPHTIERMQPTNGGAILVNGNGTSDAEKYKAAVDYMTGKGLYVLIDPHNFGGRKINGVSTKIGGTGYAITDFMDYWSKLIDYLGASPYLIYGLMNEPSGINGDVWRGAAKSTIDMIRAKGNVNRVLVPGSSFTTAATWVSSGNSTRFANFSDPVGNFAYEVHQYLDSGDSGTSGICSVDAGTRMDAFLAWARAQSPVPKAFNGEFAGGDPNVSGQAQCGTEIAGLINTMEAAVDVMAGWAWWGAGSYWNSNYIFRLEPVGGITDPDTNLMTILKAYL